VESLRIKLEFSNMKLLKLIHDLKNPTIGGLYLIDDLREFITESLEDLNHWRKNSYSQN